MGLIDLDVLTCFFLPVGAEEIVVLLIQLPGGVVGDVEEFGACLRSDDQT